MKAPFFTIILLLGALYAECQTLDLSNMPVYAADRSGSECYSWTNEKGDGYFRFGCNEQSGQWRAYAVKEVDVSSADQVTVKARLSTTSAEVHYDNYVQLVAYGSDRTSELYGCGGTISDWTNECALKDIKSGSLGSCGLPKYYDTITCEFYFDTMEHGKIYLVFRAADAWGASFGPLVDSFEDVQVCTESAAPDTPNYDYRANWESCEWNEECASRYCDSSGYCVDNPADVKKEDGEGCYNHLECQSGYCWNAVCCESPMNCCVEDTTCQNGQFCGYRHYCEWKKDAGEGCNQHHECKSGRCDMIYDKCAEEAVTGGPGDGCEWTADCDPGLWCKPGVATTDTHCCKQGNRYCCSNDHDCTNDPRLSDYYCVEGNDINQDRIFSCQVSPRTYWNAPASQPATAAALQQPGKMAGAAFAIPPVPNPADVIAGFLNWLYGR